MTKEQEGQIQGFMKLGYTREEAIQFLKEDEEGVETEEMKEMARKAKENGALKIGAKSVDAYGKKRVRERKPNQSKRDIVQVLDEALCDIADNVTVVNVERQVDFILDGINYSVTLTAHRPPKEKK